MFFHLFHLLHKPLLSCCWITGIKGDSGRRLRLSLRVGYRQLIATHYRPGEPGWGKAPEGHITIAVGRAVVWDCSEDYEVRAKGKKIKKGLGQAGQVCCPPKVVLKAGARGEEEGKRLEGDWTVAGGPESHAKECRFQPGGCLRGLGAPFPLYMYVIVCCEILTWLSTQGSVTIWPMSLTLKDSQCHKNRPQTTFWTDFLGDLSLHRSN